MVNQSTGGRPASRSPRLDRVFSALADPTRRAMLGRLARGEHTVTDLARPFSISLPAVSKHLKVLERAGLIVRRVEGRVHHCRLRPRPLEDAADWLAGCRAFWDARLDALEDYLLSTQAAHARASEPRGKGMAARAKQEPRPIPGAPAARNEE